MSYVAGSTSNTDDRGQRAIWYVPPEQVGLAERGAAADPNPSPGPPRPSTLTPDSASSPAAIKAHSVMTKEVALKIIPKKKVKGNEASVWGEMEVLKGLDHPNIVRAPPALPSDRPTDAPLP